MFGGLCLLVLGLFVVFGFGLIWGFGICLHWFCGIGYLLRDLGVDFILIFCLVDLLFMILSLWVCFGVCSLAVGVC